MRLTKQNARKSQFVTAGMFKVREVTPSVSGTPSTLDSQPIPATWSDNEVQLADKGSPNLTTGDGGFISAEQDELTGFPTSTQNVL